MSIFAEVKLKWEGREYKLQPEDMMRCIAKVEDVLTLAELYNFQQRETLPYAKIALGYTIMLQQAGARVTSEQVYTAMFSNTVGEDRRVLAIQAVRQLLVLMIPPEHYAKAATPEEAAVAVGKAEAGASG